MLHEDTEKTDGMFATMTILLPSQHMVSIHPYTIHHTPYTIHHAPCTMHHAPCTMHHPSYTIHHTSICAEVAIMKAILL